MTSFQKKKKKKKKKKKESNVVFVRRNTRVDSHISPSKGMYEPEQ